MRPANGEAPTGRSHESPPTTVGGMFEHRFASDPDAIFLETIDGLSLTYGQVAEAMERLEADFATSGIGDGDVVALYLRNEPDWVVGTLSAWRHGVTIAAIGALTPWEVAVELVAETEAKRLYTTAALQGYISGVGQVGLISLADLSGATGGSGGGAPRSSTGSPIILFTSGTTGRPKGYLFPHHRFSDDARNQARTYSTHPDFQWSVAPQKAAPVISFTAYGHPGGYDALAFALWSGRRLVLVPKLTVSAIRSLTDRYRLSALRLNPAAIYMLATTEMDINLSRLRYVYSGTAPLSQKARELFTQRFGVPILQGYGQSETGPISVSHYEDVVSGREPPGSVGRVLDTVSVRIVGPEGQVLPFGTDGEIQARTISVPSTAVGVPVPRTEDGFVKTGDVGRLDPDGFLWVTGRLSEKLVVGGFNVYPGEVEEVLRKLDEVLDAVVVGIPDDRLGERPVAGIVWNGVPRTADAEACCRRLLAAYKVPREWFSLQSVPLTAREKVDRRVARELALGLLAEHPG